MGGKKGTRSGNLSGRSAWCNTCSYNVYWVHHKASQPAAGWRCTDINYRKNWGDLNHRIPRAFKHCFMELRFWAGKKSGFTFPIIFEACESWGCRAWFLCLRGHGVLQCHPAALCGDNAIVAGTIPRLSPACLHRLFSACPGPGQPLSSWARRSWAPWEICHQLSGYWGYPIVGNTAWLETRNIPLRIFNTQK